MAGEAAKEWRVNEGQRARVWDIERKAALVRRRLLRAQLAAMAAEKLVLDRRPAPQVAEGDVPPPPPPLPPRPPSAAAVA
eukprot:3501352-Pyramimonas_sp.AAC.1